MNTYFELTHEITYDKIDGSVPNIQMPDGYIIKHHWYTKDYFNATDYNRIVNNLLILKGLVSHLFPEISYKPMELNKTYTSMIYASELNAIEDNLEILNAGTYNLPIGNKRVFSPNGNTPDADELNRIENGCLLLYNKLNGNIECMPRLETRLGNVKGVRV